MNTTYVAVYNRRKINKLAVLSYALSLCSPFFSIFVLAFLDFGSFTLDTEISELSVSGRFPFDGTLASIDSFSDLELVPALSLVF